MKEKLRAVIDTNIIISAAIGKSAAFKTMFDAFIEGAFTPILSPALQEELLNVIKKPHLRKYFRAQEVKRFRELIRTDAILVSPKRKIAVCRDPDDDIVLETALEGRADFVVTSDKDLLILKTFSHIPIISARQFLKILNKQ